MYVAFACFKFKIKLHIFFIKQGQRVGYITDYNLGRGLGLKSCIAWLWFMWLKTNKTQTLLGLDRGCSRRICTSIVVSVAVCRPGSVLAQAVGCDRGWAVVAQRWRPTSTAVHILHVHAAVTAGQVVFTHPAEHKHTALIYLFMSTSVQGMRTDMGTLKNVASLNYQHCLNHTHTHTQRCYVTMLTYVVVVVFLLN